MDNNINVKEYGWTDSSDSNFSIDLFEEEMEPDLLSSDQVMKMRCLLQGMVLWLYLMQRMLQVKGNSGTFVPLGL